MILMSPTSKMNSPQPSHPDPVKTALLKQAIRDIPDFPKPGIVFKDIAPLCADPVAFKTFIDLLEQEYAPLKPDRIVCVDARGFLFGGALADRLGAGAILVRKKGKLPGPTHSIEYELEYGSATLEIQQDAFPAGDRVVIVDDLLATGGTVAATVELCRKLGATILGCAFLMELTFLPGRSRLNGVPIFSPLQVTEE
jgi:adenine phosphoribosyltransferase